MSHATTRKQPSDIKTYIKGFHIEGNISGLQMPLFYSKASATGDLQRFMNFEDEDVYSTRNAIGTRLYEVLISFANSKNKRLASVTRSEFQKMFAMELLALCSRKQYDALYVEAIEFFTQLFLNSYVTSNILQKEVHQIRRGSERHNRVLYTAAS